MEIKKVDALYANLLGVFIIIMAGLLVERCSEMNFWFKAFILAMAFIFFVLSERFWIVGKNFLKHRK